jgi:hypothetical protein
MGKGQVNEALSQFVAETQAMYAHRLRKPEELFHRESNFAELLDIAVLSGYSVADIVSGKVIERDIDPRVLDAFHKQYPNAGDFIPFIRSHEGDARAIGGIVSGVKGKLFEIVYLDWLNKGHLPSGAVAELAISPTQPGWDIIIRDSNGLPIQYLQLKATESMGYIRAAFAAHPDIDVVTTREVFERIDALERPYLRHHVIDSQFLNEHIEKHVRDGIDGAEMTPEFEFPLIAFGIIAVQSLKGYLGGKTSALDALRSGTSRGLRTLVCRAAAYVSILISHEPGVGLPTSILARLVLGRHDAQKRGLVLLTDLAAAQRAKRTRLLTTMR